MKFVACSLLRRSLLLACSLVMFGRLATAAVGATTVAPVPHNTTQAKKEQTIAASPVCGPRIRKSWDMLSLQEQELYLRALARSMDDGYYIKFVEIHTEQMTTMEAHRTCMFIYWHRLFLLGFENMLRSYGGEFSCLTVPYWNYVDHNALFMEGRCRSMLDCSPILRALGGSSFGREASVTINGTPIQGTCVPVPPLNHFCQASNLLPNQCSRCVPRGNWATAGFPATTSVGSLMRQLFATPTIASVATNIEQGVHNTIHNALDGAMAFLEAPADPIFFSHHATLDLLHSIYYNCVVGNQVPVPIEQELADPRVFMTCPRRESLRVGAVDDNVLMPQSFVSLRSGGVVARPESVFSPMNELAPFFAGLPTEYLGLSDLRNLGAFSYNYEMTGLLANMYSTCGGAAMLNNLRAGGQPFRRLEGTNESGHAAKDGWIEAVVVPSNHSTMWFDEALAAAVNASSASDSAQSLVEAFEDIEKMTCVFYDECRGGVVGFSDQFRQNFGLSGNTPCRTIVDDITDGRDHIRTPKWRDIFLRHLDCGSEV